MMDHLNVAKIVLNSASKVILRHIPVAEPTFPDTIVFARYLDKLIEEAVKEEANTDGKFTNLLRAVKRAILYIAEKDSYYHRWLCTAMGMFSGAYDDMDRLFNDVQVCGNYNKVTMWRRQKRT